MPLHFRAHAEGLTLPKFVGWGNLVFKSSPYSGMSKLTFKLGGNMIKVGHGRFDICVVVVIVLLQTAPSISVADC
jgi:hypothetical protein